MKLLILKFKYINFEAINRLVFVRRTAEIVTKPKEKVLNILKRIVDPEIGANIVDLGLIYGIKAEKDKVKILMTLTSIGCPLTGLITSEVESELKKAGFKKVEIELTFNPPWTPERMSKQLRKKLGI